MICCSSDAMKKALIMFISGSTLSRITLVLALSNLATSISYGVVA